MPSPTGGEDAVADRMIQQANLAGSDRGRHFALELGGDSHVVREVDDVVDAGGLHRLQGRDVPRQEQRLVGGDHAHVAVVEVMELSAGEMTRRIVEYVAHGELVRLERLLVGIGLERRAGLP